MKLNKHSARINQSILFGIMWALLLSLIKAADVLLYKNTLSNNTIKGMWLAAAGNMAWGTLIGLLILDGKHTRYRWYGYITGLVTGLVFLLMRHYELIFNSLPYLNIAYYLKELPNLLPSVKASFPPMILIVEISLLLSFIFGGRYLIVFLYRSRTKEGALYYSGVILLTICISITAFIHLFPASINNDEMFWASRNPLLWTIQSAYEPLKSSSTSVQFDKDTIHRFHVMLRPNQTDHIKDIKFPLLTAPQKPRQYHKKNIIILILESVGTKEMFDKENGSYIMPNLIRIAEENLYFHNFFACGSKSAQALPAIFAGLPPQTFSYLLWRQPLPHVQGIPNLFSTAGYKTGFFHGGDLTFEQQRSFLKTIGFDYIFDYDPTLEKKSMGWGYDDRVMLHYLEKWIKNQHTQNNNYLASLTTLSTHHPFMLPLDWKPRITKDKVKLDRYGVSIAKEWNQRNQTMLFKESLCFLDEALGDFYDWYKQEGYAEDTLLVITSDHNSFIPEKHRRFSVPLIMAGFSGNELTQFKGYTNRRGSQMDIPATLTNYIGLASLKCDNGLNLLMPEVEWPRDRLIYSVGGNSLEGVYIWTDDGEVEYNRTKKSLQIIDYEIPKGMPHGNNPQFKKKVSDFLSILLPLNRYLYLKDAYYPSNYQTVKYQPLPKVKFPFFVSHRGNTQGMRPARQQNKSHAIEEAIKAGFEWVEVDIRMTKDGVLILSHDPQVTIAKNEKVNIGDITFQKLKEYPEHADIITLSQVLDKYLNQVGLLIEIKPFEDMGEMVYGLRKISAMINKIPRKDKIIIDSFSPLIAGSVKTKTDRDVGLDTPLDQKLTNAQLHAIKFSGMDWIYVHYSKIDDHFIQTAHNNGLKVMAYTVNEIQYLYRWSNNLPDGIITDTIDLKIQWEAHLKQG